MKGITPVIAIILLLLITISMVGFAFVWFQRVAQTATDSTDTQLQQQLAQQAEKIRIESGAGTSVTLRNTGSQALPVGSVALFVNNAQSTNSCPGSSQAAGAVFTCTLSSSCASGNTLKATAPGNTDQITCP